MERIASRARTIDLYGVAAMKSGELEKARQCFDRALKLLDSAYGPVNVHTASVLAHIGDLFRVGLQDPHGARLRYLNALVILKKVCNLEHPLVVELMVNTGYTYMAQKKSTTATDWFDRAAAVSRSAKNRDHPNLIVPDLLRRSGTAWLKPNEYGRTVDERSRHASKVYGSEDRLPIDAKQYIGRAAAEAEIIPEEQLNSRLFGPVRRPLTAIESWLTSESREVNELKDLKESHSSLSVEVLPQFRHAARRGDSFAALAKSSTRPRC